MNLKEIYIIKTSFNSSSGYKIVIVSCIRNYYSKQNTLPVNTFSKGAQLETCVRDYSGNMSSVRNENRVKVHGFVYILLQPC